MKTKFIVTYSEKKDLQVYLDALWKPLWVDYGKNNYEIAKKYLPIEFLNSLVNAKSKEKAVEIVKKYWHDIRSPAFLSNSKLISKWFGKMLNEEAEDRIIKSLEKVYRQKFPFSQIHVYLTSYISCPYDYEQGWYMANRNSSIFWFFDTSIHELNHFMFYYYFDKKLEKQGFTLSQRECLKEALAVLTSSNPAKENQEKTKVLPIQNFVQKNKFKSVEEIINLVIQNKLLDNIE